MSRLKIEEMGFGYLFIVLYVWLERLLTQGDYGWPAADLPASPRSAGALADAVATPDGR